MADLLGKRWENQIRLIIPEQFTAVQAQEPLISKRLYKKIASMEAAIFNCQCDQMQDCEDGCETIYLVVTEKLAIDSFWYTVYQ